MTSPPIKAKATKYLLVHPERCTGCGRCELWCSLVKRGVQNPAKSLVRILADGALNVPVVCVQCGLCESACSTGAIIRDKATGAVVIREEKCIGCKRCIGICPIGIISFDKEAGIARKCDLCGGTPACVEHCPENAIEYADAVEVGRSRQRIFASNWSARERFWRDAHAK